MFLLGFRVVVGRFCLVGHLGPGLKNDKLFFVCAIFYIFAMCFDTVVCAICCRYCKKDCSSCFALLGEETCSCRKCCKWFWMAICFALLLVGGTTFGYGVHTADSKGYGEDNVPFLVGLSCLSAFILLVGGYYIRRCVQNWRKARQCSYEVI